MTRVPAKCPPGFAQRYTVRSGDTMWLLAQRFGVTLAALSAANPHIKDPAKLYPGDVLCVPGVEDGRVPEKCPPGFQGRYTVKPTDTMWLLAQRFGVTLAALSAANPHITDPAVLFPGDELCVPDEEPPVPPPEPEPCVGKGIMVYHIIRPTQTLSTLVGLYGIPLARLIRANPELRDPDVVFPGQTLRVPITPPLLPPVQRLVFEYVVQAGDTLTTIANRFETTVSAILAANPLIVDPDTIFRGQIVYIPVVKKPLPAPVPGILYVVRPTDTFSAIAARFSVTVGALAAANPQIVDPNVLFAFELLVIPRNGIPEPPVFQQRRYVVQPDDTWEDIAERFGVTEAALSQVNLFPEPVPGLVVAIPTVVPSPEAVQAAEIALKKWDRPTAVTMMAIAGAESAWQPTAGGDTPRTLFELESAFAQAALGYNCPLGDMDGPASWGLWQIFMPLHAQIRVNDQLVPSKESLLGRLSAPIDDPCQTAAWLRDPWKNARAAAAILKQQGFQAWTTYRTGAYKAFLSEAEAAVSAALAKK